MNIALFGTSADPPSIGHQQILQWLDNHYDRTVVWVSDNPFKTHQASLRDRIAMMELTIAAIQPPAQTIGLHPEISNPRTINTVEQAKQIWQDTNFTLVIGGDLVPQLPTWYRAQDLLNQVNLLVVPRQGWNADSAIKTNVELIGVFKKQYPKTTKVVAWGNSLGGFITQALAEKYPDLISAAAPLCMASDLTPLMTMAGDALWGIKTFFDPTIKGGGYSAGAAGYAEAMGDLGKVLTVAGAMSAAIAANPTAPAWPATSTVPAALKAVPSRSALVLVGLMAGLPMQSAHFDSTSAPAGLPASNALSFQLAINPALATLENVTNAAAVGVLFAHDIEQQAGGAVFDNTATDYSARVSAERFIWSSALTGEAGANALLGYLAAVPRVKGNPAAIAKLATLTSHTGKVEIPTILFTGTADPVTTPGNQQAVIDKYAAYSADGD